jgi:hypothetical protein
VEQIQGTPAPGDYVLAALPAVATDWDHFEGLQSNFGVSGQHPPFGLGSYHLDISGDFTVTEILEGELDIVPEPSALVLAGFAAACILALCCKRAGPCAARIGSTSRVVHDPSPFH